MHFSFPYMYHMPCPSHLPRSDHMNNICSGLQMMKLSTHFCPATPHSYLFGRQRYGQQICGQTNYKWKLRSLQYVLKMLFVIAIIMISIFASCIESKCWVLIYTPRQSFWHLTQDARVSRLKACSIEKNEHWCYIYVPKSSLLCNVSFCNFLSHGFLILLVGSVFTPDYGRGWCASAWLAQGFMGICKAVLLFVFVIWVLLAHFLHLLNLYTEVQLFVCTCEMWNNKHYTNICHGAWQNTVPNNGMPTSAMIIVNHVTLCCKDSDNCVPKLHENSSMVHLLCIRKRIL